ncbi:hypothetical protein LCGC14_2814290 [marine sediment metagenome]|uniref:Uncharacterized protein n=1 Tax=marine sediment metagenome TaxID=412755 RepID=A0A0F8YJ16_9ZZZZ
MSYRRAAKRKAKTKMRVLPKTISEEDLLKGVKAAKSNWQRLALYLAENAPGAAE